MDNKRKIRLFEMFDVMNVNDTNNGTKNLPVGLDLVSAEYKKGRGTVVSIGIDGSTVKDIMTEKVRPLLVMLDMDLYRSMENNEVLDSYGVDQIRDERLKQIDKHGFTGKWQAVDHPEYYTKGQLVEAARMLIMWTDEQSKVNSIPRPFGWDKEWFTNLMLRPFEERIRIAGALLAAELDRLKYLTDNKTQSDDGQ